MVTAFKVLCSVAAQALFTCDELASFVELTPVNRSFSFAFMNGRRSQQERHQGRSSRGIFTTTLTGQWLVVIFFLAAFATLSRWHEGTPFWLGSLVGLLAVAGLFVQFDSVANWRRGLLCTLALILGFLFLLLFIVCLFTS